MPRYAPERKEALLKKLLPPHNLSVARLAREEGISDATLYAWRKHAKAGGAAVPGNQKLTDHWSAEAKLAVVIETAALSEIGLSEYCLEILPAVAAGRLCQPGRRPGLGQGLPALVQHRASAQPDPLRHTDGAPPRPGY